jgi:hypothetical protein
MPLRRFVVTAVLLTPLCLPAQSMSPATESPSGGHRDSPSQTKSKSLAPGASHSQKSPSVISSAKASVRGSRARRRRPAVKAKAVAAPPLEAASEQTKIGGLSFSRLPADEEQPQSARFADHASPVPCSEQPCPGSCPAGELEEDGLCISHQPLPQCPAGEAPADGELNASGGEECMKLSDLRITDCGPLARMLDETEIRVHLAEAAEQAACAHQATGQECAERKSQHKDAITRHKQLQLEHDRCLLE